MAVVNTLNTQTHSSKETSDLSFGNADDKGICYCKQRMKSKLSLSSECVETKLCKPCTSFTWHLHSWCGMVWYRTSRVKRKFTLTVSLLFTTPMASRLKPPPQAWETMVQISAESPQLLHDTTLVATVPEARRQCKDWLANRALPPGQMASLICNFCLSWTGRKNVFSDLSLRFALFADVTFNLENKCFFPLIENKQRLYSPHTHTQDSALQATYCRVFCFNVLSFSCRGVGQEITGYNGLQNWNQTRILSAREPICQSDSDYSQQTSQCRAKVLFSMTDTGKLHTKTWATLSGQSNWKSEFDGWMKILDWTASLYTHGQRY